MKVIGKDGLAEQIDAKLSRKTLQFALQPPFAVVVVFAGKRILPQQKAPPHRPVHDMDDRNLVRPKDLDTCYASHKYIL
jgi:hypothetical protein